jgi:predicted dienelactone hydrolase/preprotein translocase subunit Sec61beta
LRRFELILLGAVVFAVAWPVLFGTRARRGIAAILLSAGLVVHWQFEGFRWQMIPLYIVAFGLAIGDVLFIERGHDWRSRVTRGIAGLGGVFLAAVLPLALPVPQLPEPSGPEAIGTFTIQLIDRERPEAYGGSPGGPRKFVAQVWYPAQPVDDAEPEPWSQDWDVVAPAMSLNLGFPRWFLNHTQYTNSHAYESLPVAAGTFPVVIFSHGWTGFRTIAINQVEHLVSNGYVVIAADHTYGAVATRLDDGEVVEHDPAALPDEDSVPAAQYQAAATGLVATYSGDLIAILNELDEGSGGAFAPLADTVDLNRIGIYGHSTGGGAAIKTCLEDERCTAVLGLDPWVEPLTEADLRLTMTRPALYLRSDEWRGNQNDALLAGIAGRGESVTYMVGVEGAGHNDFLVTPLLSPIGSQLGLRGPIPAGRVVPIVDNYLLGFFDVFLLGTGSAALDSVSFPEVTLQVIEP